MKNVAILLLAVAVAALSIFAYQQDRLVRELTAKVDQQAKAQPKADLGLQQKCAQQAREKFTFDGWDKTPSAEFENHYNSRLNKCFMLLKNMTESLAQDGTSLVTRTLTDAFEGKEYAEYMWNSDKGKKYWEVPPFVCKVTLLSGEEMFCHSTEEFDELIKKLYME